MDTIDLIQYKIESTLSCRRLKHVYAAARVCLYLADRFCLDYRSALIAALWHDSCREWDELRLKRYARRFNMELTDLERRETVLLHGPAAAYRLFHELSCTDRDAWLAIRWHTTGDPRMGPLGLALFTADFIEPLRDHLDDAKREELLSFGSLEEMVLHIYRMQCSWFEQQQISVDEHSLRLYRQLEEQWGQ